MPAAASVTLPFLVDYPWPDVPNSQYGITQVGVHEGEVAAVSPCVSPAGRGERWWYRVRDLPAVTDDQRAALAMMVLAPSADRSPVASMGAAAVPNPRETSFVPILYLPPDAIFVADLQWRNAAQIGKRCHQLTWSGLVRFLSRSRAADIARFPDLNVAKRARGGWAGGRYRGNHRDTSALIDTNVIVFDIDGGGDVGRIASFFAEYRKVVHSTLKSTPAAPRCRVVLQLKSACAAPLTYKRAHKVVQEKLKGAGFDVDAGASEAVRLNFLPMHQPGLEPRFVETDGELFDLDGWAAHAPDVRLTPTAKTNPTAGGSRGERYKDAALRGAYRAVAEAAKGERHSVFFKEAASLARPALGATDAEITDTLLPVYLRVSDDTDEEARRILRDALDAGRSGR